MEYLVYPSFRILVRHTILNLIFTFSLCVDDNFNQEVMKYT